MKNIFTNFSIIISTLSFHYTTANLLSIQKFHELNSNLQHQRTVQTLKHIQPILTNEENTIFSDIRLKLTESNTEINLGGALRSHIQNNKFFGVYSFVDYMVQQEHEKSSKYTQITLGSEFYNSGKILRINSYTPLLEKVHPVYSKLYSTPDGNTYQVDIFNTARTGFDLSLGLDLSRISANIGSFYYIDKDKDQEKLLGNKAAISVRPFESGTKGDIEFNAEIARANSQNNIRVGSSYKFNTTKTQNKFYNLSTAIPIERDVDIVLKETVKIENLKGGQFGQARDVAEYFKGKRNGYFLEVGAHEGIKTSNTYGLEKSLGWKGMCIEAAPQTFEKLTKNRPNCNNLEYAVSDVDGKSVIFSVSSNDYISGIKDSLGTKWKNTVLSDSEEIILQTKSLQTILKEQHAPQRIDFMSLDVEGEELNVLKGVDLNDYWIEFITLEHNNEHPRREELKTYMLEQGYYHLAQNKVDDYYIKPHHETLEKY